MSVRVLSHDHQHAPNKLKRSNYIDTSIYVSYNEIFVVLSVERGGKQKSLIVMEKSNFYKLKDMGFLLCGFDTTI